MHEKEKRIKEQRLIEATRKGLTGLDGKFGCILKYLGTPMLSHGGSNYYRNEMVDVYAYLDEEEELPTLDEDQIVTDSGLHFDALPSGVHMEIIYNSDLKQLKCYYKGELVYFEDAGDLEGYIPGIEWEAKLDYFYNVAKKRENQSRRLQGEENKLEAERQKLSLLDRLKRIWGI